MFVWKWFSGVLQSWGLMNKSAKILLLGLDNAGKTTLLHMMRDNRLVQHKPTRNPTSEDLTMGSITFRTYDLDGHREARRLWKDYYSAVDAIVYLVDASDQERTNESKVELDALLTDADLQQTPFIVLGNKIDKDDAMSEPHLRGILGLQQTSGKGTVSLPDTIRPIEVLMCSIVKREGYGYRNFYKWKSHSRVYTEQSRRPAMSCRSSCTHTTIRRA